MTASTNVKYDFDPALPSPGEDYDKFEERLLNAGSAQTDDRGYSLADHFLGINKGSAGGPALPVGGAGPKAQIKLRQRQKNSYGMLTKHVLDADHLTEMKNSYFQLGHGAFTYLQTSSQRAVNPLRLREMNKDFDDIVIDIVLQVGIETNTIKLLWPLQEDPNQTTSREPKNAERVRGEAARSYLHDVEAFQRASDSGIQCASSVAPLPKCRYGRTLFRRTRGALSRTLVGRNDRAAAGLPHACSPSQVSGAHSQHARAGARHD